MLVSDTLAPTTENNADFVPFPEVEAAPTPAAAAWDATLAGLAAVEAREPADAPADADEEAVVAVEAAQARWWNERESVAEVLLEMQPPHFAAIAWKVKEGASWRINVEAGTAEDDTHPLIAECIGDAYRALVQAGDGDPAEIGFAEALTAAHHVELLVRKAAQHEFQRVALNPDGLVECAERYARILRETRDLLMLSQQGRNAWSLAFEIIHYGDRPPGMEPSIRTRWKTAIEKFAPLDAAFVEGILDDTTIPLDVALANETAMDAAYAEVMDCLAPDIDALEQQFRAFVNLWLVERNERESLDDPRVLSRLLSHPNGETRAIASLYRSTLFLTDRYCSSPLLDAKPLSGSH